MSEKNDITDQEENYIHKRDINIPNQNDNIEDNESFNQQNLQNENNSLIDNLENSDVRTLSFDNILQQIGMGVYQLKIYLIFGLIGLTEGSQITVFTLMIPILKKQWDVNDDMNSLGTSIVFIGFLLGAMLSGYFSDRFGRQIPFQVAVTLTIFFTLSQAIVGNMIQLVIVRGFLGLLIGFQGPLGATMLTEITPKTVRGRYMSLIQLSISLGQLYGLFVGSQTLETASEGNWRQMVFWTGFPGLFAIICVFLFLDESAMFLLQNEEKQDEAIKILQKMNDSNGQKEFENITLGMITQLKLWAKIHLVQNEQTEEISLKQLFQGEKLAFLTPVIWFNWFVSSFLYYGIVILLPLLLDSIENSTSIMGENVFIKLSFSSSSEILAACLAAFLIEQKGLGRKNSMILFFTLTGMVSTLVYYDDISRFELWAMLAKFFLTMTIIFVYQFTAEIYPTKIRTTGIGMSNGVGRTGGIVMPWVCLFLVSIDLMSPFLLFSFFAITTAILDIYLPYDTLGRDLDS